MLATVRLCLDPARVNPLEDGVGAVTPNSFPELNGWTYREDRDERLSQLSSTEGYCGQASTYRQLFLDRPEGQFWALDGLSGVYHCRRPLAQFADPQGRRWSGGEMVTRLVSEFWRQNPHLSVTELVHRANQLILNWHLEQKVDWSDPVNRAGTTFALAQFDPSGSTLRLAQAGDAMAVWRYRDGTLGWTDNKVGPFDRLGVVRRAEYLAEVRRLGLQNEKAQVQALFGEQHLTEGRHCYMNCPANPQGFGVLNGDANLQSFVTTFDLPVADLDLLLLVSDGMLPSLLDQPEAESASWLIDAYMAANYHWRPVVQRIRRQERERGSGHVEACGVALRFH